MTLPVQEFQIGQRVRKGSEPPFVIRGICLTSNGWILYSINDGYPYFTASELTLAPERPPYVASERLVVKRALNGGATGWDKVMIHGSFRCETDAELAARHAAERAAYDHQDATDPVIYNASGEPVGITGRTGQPGPGAA